MFRKSKQGRANADQALPCIVIPFRTCALGPQMGMCQRGAQCWFLLGFPFSPLGAKGTREIRCSRARLFCQILEAAAEANLPEAAEYWFSQLRKQGFRASLLSRSLEHRQIP